MGTRHFLPTRKFTINFDEIIMAAPAPSESDAICQQLRDMLTDEAYAAWVAAGPDDNPAFLEYAREKLAAELAAYDKQEQEAQGIVDWVNGDPRSPEERALDEWADDARATQDSARREFGSAAWFADIDEIEF